MLLLPFEEQFGDLKPFPKTEATQHRATPNWAD